MAIDLIKIGYVARAHGIRGALRVHASENLSSLKQVYIGGELRKIRRIQPEKDDYLVELDGLSDRNQAELLRGASVEIERKDLPPADEDEVYVSDLIGCNVFTTQGESLGSVKETFHSGAHEMLVVTGAHEFMLPFVEPIITEVDVAGRRIICDPPVGLVNLDDADK